MKYPTRSIVLCFSIFLLFSMVSTVEAKQFPDIDGITPDLQTAISTLTDQGIIQGYPDGSFRPQVAISEQEWNLLVGRVVNDVDGAVLSGQPITRLGALYLLASKWNISWLGESNSSHFSDVYSDSDVQLVNYFERRGIIHGRSSIVFAPHDSLTRAEAAKILLLAQQLINGSPSISPTTSSSPVVRSPTNLMITQNVVEIVDVTPLNLSPGEVGTMLFTIKNHGELESGLEEGTDYVVSVLSGDVHILSVSEIGNGLYQVRFQAFTSAAAGPVNIGITAFMGSTFHTDLNEFLQHRSSSQIDMPQMSLAQLIPSHLFSGQKAQIIVTPQGIGGAPVTGLDISAEVTKGSGTIINPVTESPAGSGIYVGTYQATGTGRQNVEITVRINNVSSRPQTVIQATID